MSAASGAPNANSNSFCASRHFAAAAFSVGVVALTYLLFAVVLKTPLEPGILGF